MSAIRPVSERDSGVESGRLEHRDRPLLSYFHQSSQTAQSSKNTAASQNARGAGHLCLLSGWGLAV